MNTLLLTILYNNRAKPCPINSVTCPATTALVTSVAMSFNACKHRLINVGLGDSSVSLS